MLYSRSGPLKIFATYIQYNISVAYLSSDILYNLAIFPKIRIPIYAVVSTCNQPIIWI